VRIALLGGSFDPVHLGHMLIADEAASRFGYDAVVFVPAAVSPHKADANPASAEDRLAMLNAAVLGDRRFLVDDCELRRSGVSYTIDTVDDIERRYLPEGRLGLIIGEDLVSGFSTWQRAAELASRVDIILATRPGYACAEFAYPHRRLENAALSVSSSSVRSLIERGEPWRFLVPEAAGSRIRERGLYGCPAVAESDARKVARAVESLAVSELSIERYLHSRGVARLAADLCARFGLDPDLGYLAGISHDLCKEMAPDRIVALAVLDGAPLSAGERAKPALLHARAAANFLESRFGFRDESVLAAIRNHTFGSRGMDGLSKAVYVADKIEPSRRSVSPGIREMLSSAGLEELFAGTVSDTVRYLRERGKTVSPETESLLAECRGNAHADQSVPR